MYRLYCFLGQNLHFVTLIIGQTWIESIGPCNQIKLVTSISSLISTEYAKLELSAML